MFPARREWVEWKASPEIHYGHNRSAIGFQYITSPIKKAPANQACGSDESDTSNYEVPDLPRLKKADTWREMSATQFGWPFRLF